MPGDFCAVGGFGGEELGAEVARFVGVGCTTLAGLADFELGVRCEEAGVVAGPLGELAAARGIEGGSAGGVRSVRDVGAKKRVYLCAVVIAVVVRGREVRW